MWDATTGITGRTGQRPRDESWGAAGFGRRFKLRSSGERLLLGYAIMAILSLGAIGGVALASVV